MIYPSGWIEILLQEPVSILSWNSWIFVQRSSIEPSNSNWRQLTSTGNGLSAAVAVGIIQAVKVFWSQGLLSWDYSFVIVRPFRLGRIGLYGTVIITSTAIRNFNIRHQVGEGVLSLHVACNYLEQVWLMSRKEHPWITYRTPPIPTKSIWPLLLDELTLWSFTGIVQLESFITTQEQSVPHSSCYTSDSCPSEQPWNSISYQDAFGNGNGASRGGLSSSLAA